MFDLERATQQLSTHHFKLTRQRRAVLDAIAAAQSPLTPADVFERAQKRCSDLGLATVYRTLEILEDLNLIKRVHLNEHCEGFAPSTLSHGHHAICVKCKRVVEFSGCDISAVIASAARQTGFHIETHWLELLGTCGECSASQKKRGKR